MGFWHGVSLHISCLGRVSAGYIFLLGGQEADAESKYR